jgi:transcriptional regulator with XRE-family HTH domain
MTNEKTVAGLLKDSRERKGMLLREVAAAIGADTALISKFEKGERRPTKEQIAKLAKSLRIDEKELYTLFLSERLVEELREEVYAEQALKLAQRRIKEIHKTVRK